MTAVRLGFAAVAIVLGVGCLTLAHDVRSWNDAMHQGDTHFAREPEAARWQASTWVPTDPAASLLGLNDDLALRRAERAFAAASAAPSGFSSNARQAQLRAEAEVALGDVVTTGSRAQASRAGNLLGILAVPTGNAQGAAANELRASDTFDAAIRADDGNDDAKYNLELLLRRIRVVGEREGAGNGAGDLGDALAGAGSGNPGSGY